MTVLLGPYFTHCISSCWFASVVDTRPVEVWKPPLWVVSVKSNGEWGATWTPWTPSRALLWFRMLFWVMSSPTEDADQLEYQQQVAGTGYLASVQSSQQCCIKKRVLVLLHKIWNQCVCSFIIQPKTYKHEELLMTMII